MAELIRNRLIITCQDTELRNKIKEVIFMNNEKNEKIFTMEKLLPMPEGFSDAIGWNDFGYEWTYAVWGAKWVENSYISESGYSISINYDTPWVPNLFWVEALCRYIDYVSREFVCDKEVRENISITHTYYPEYEGLGTKMEWKPDIGFSYIENVERV
jgi:hypothetical protein